MTELIALSLLFTVLGLVFYYFFWQKYQRRKTIEEMAFPKKFKTLLKQQFRPYKFLSKQQKLKLQKKILYFITYKKFWPLGELEVNEDMKVLIAAQACLLVLKDKPLESFPQLVNIFLAESAYVEKENFVDPYTLLPEHDVRIGESWKGGPVVLAWENIASDLENWHDGRNLVLHEFAHQLDSMDHEFDGTPTLRKSKDYKVWQAVMTKNFLALREKVASLRPTKIDPYAETNEAEFFAVTVEEFFSKSKSFKKHHFEMYELYSKYFELDPAEWDI